MMTKFIYLSLVVTSVLAVRLKKTDDKWAGELDSNWYANLGPVDASSPAPANRLLKRDNACLIKTGSEYPMGQEEPRVLSRNFKMAKIPEGYTGRIVKGTMLLATVHHFNNYIWGNIGHWSSTAYATFDALDALKEHNEGTLPINVTAVLMPQAHSLKEESWHKQVAQLIGNSNGLKTDFLMDKDMEKGVICAEQIVLFHRPDKNERHYFTSPQHALAFQEQAIKALGLPDELRASVRKPGRVLNMILRKDGQGYRNWGQINEETKKYLATRCWEMVEYEQKKEPLRNQALAWTKGDLSVSVHGAHFSNLVFQGQKTGTIVVEKPGVWDLDNCELGQEMGILTYKAGPHRNPKCMKEFMAMQAEKKKKKFALDRKESETDAEAGGEVGAQEMDEMLENLGTMEMGSTPSENAPMFLNFAKDFKPVLEQAINDLEAIAVRGPPCKNQ